MTRATPPTTVFVVHGEAGYMAPGPDYFREVAPQQRFRFLELPGLRDGQRTPETIDALADVYFGQIVRERAEGPVRLASFCIGHLVATAIALKLRAARMPYRLVLVDPALAGRVVHAERRFGWQTEEFRSFVASTRWAARKRDAAAALLRAQVADGSDGLVMRHPGLAFSVPARAAFVAAFCTHVPAAHPFPTWILSSSQRAGIYARQPSIWDRILPRRVMKVIGATHDDLLAPGSSTARELLRAFAEPVPEEWRRPRKEEMGVDEPYPRHWLHG